MRKTYGLLERGREYWREAEREREREEGKRISLGESPTRLTAFI